MRHTDISLIPTVSSPSFFNGEPSFGFIHKGGDSIQFEALAPLSGGTLPIRIHHEDIPEGVDLPDILAAHDDISQINPTPEVRYKVDCSRPPVQIIYEDIEVIRRETTYTYPVLFEPCPGEDPPTVVDVVIEQTVWPFTKTPDELILKDGTEKSFFDGWAESENGDAELRNDANLSTADEFPNDPFLNEGTDGNIKPE